MAIAGGCLCGAVRFEIDADAPLTVRQCWCRVCQYLGAGSGMVSAGFLKDAVNVSGPLTDYVSCADSGSVMHRRFCPQCGTQVFSEAEPRPQMAQSTVSRLFRAGTRRTRIAMKPPVPATTESLQDLAATTPTRVRCVVRSRGLGHAMT
jgi:hypothetical protein